MGSGLSSSLSAMLPNLDKLLQSGGAYVTIAFNDKVDLVRVLDKIYGIGVVPEVIGDNEAMKMLVDADNRYNIVALLEKELDADGINLVYDQI